MKLLGAIFSEAFGLFVDDGPFALTILIWLAIVAAAARFIPPAAHFAAGMLCGGLVIILLDSAVRRARK